MRGQTVSLCLCLAALSGPCAAQASLFESRSAQPGSNMDIVIRETERRARASVLQIQVNRTGSSVGSSFFVLCSVRRLAQQRGGSRTIAKLEDTPSHGSMLVGFLRDAAEPPADADEAFRGMAGRTVIVDLEQFAPICDRMN